MSKYVDLDNPQIHKMGRDKFGNVIYHIPPDIPLVDVCENKHGEWIDKIHDNIYECSKCGDMWMGVGGCNYCPSCGARMDGDK